MKLEPTRLRCLAFLLLLTSSLSFHLVHAQGVTNPPATSTTTLPPPTTTTPAPTTTTTTQVQTTTTTLPPTTTIAPNQPRTEIGATVIGQCLCDLTGNECDINCCCDDECTAADNATFVCNPVSIVIDDKKCFSEELFPFSNNPSQTKRENGLFCIYYDNNNERNFYLDPDFILSMPSFKDYVNRYSKPSIQQPVPYVEPVFTFSSTYKKGDPVYVVYPNLSRGYLSLPVSSTTGLCNDGNPIAILNESQSNCVRQNAILATTCTSTAAFNAATYYSNFRVVLTPALFGYVVNGSFIGITTPAPITPAPTAAPTQAPTTPNPVVNNTGSTQAPTTTTPAPTTTTTPAPTVVNPALVQSLYDNPYTMAINTTALPPLCYLGPGNITACTSTNLSPPTWNGATCQNVVMEARYFLTMNGSFGLSEVAVQFVFRNIQQTDLPFMQSFSVNYKSATDGAVPVARSGNPGYLIGKPLLYGTLVADAAGNQQIEIATSPANGLTLVRGSATGECVTSASDRLPVRFGENMRTGCVISLNMTSFTPSTCAEVQTTIIRALEGPNTPEFDMLRSEWIENNRFVATFGNVPANRVGDWVRVIQGETVNRRPIPLATSTQVLPPNTCRLSMGLHIQVLYANVGALANPQSKIIGVALLYDEEREVKYRCTGAFCQDDTATENQIFEVSNTISFVDVSQPAVKQQGEPPIFIARVPNDFFYPFLYYSSSSYHTAPITALVVVVSMVASVFSCL